MKNGLKCKGCGKSVLMIHNDGNGPCCWKAEKIDLGRTERKEPKRQRPEQYESSIACQKELAAFLQHQGMSQIGFSRIIGANHSHISKFMDGQCGKVAQASLTQKIRHGIYMIEHDVVER